MTARPGEIVALMGVEGSGARELLRSFGGLERCTGSLAIAGQAGGGGGSPQLPMSRRRASSASISNFSVGENLLVRLGTPEIAGFAMALKRKRMRELAYAAVTRFLVKARSLSQAIRSLSGGNQQKVAIAQALNRAPRLLLLEEPTRGVDIRSKREIYRLLRELRRGGQCRDHVLHRGARSLRGRRSRLRRRRGQPLARGPRPRIRPRRRPRDRHHPPRTAPPRRYL